MKQALGIISSRRFDHASFPFIPNIYIQTVEHTWTPLPAARYSRVCWAAAKAAITPTAPSTAVDVVTTEEVCSTKTLNYVEERRRRPNEDSLWSLERWMHQHKEEMYGSLTSSDFIFLPLLQEEWILGLSHYCSLRMHMIHFHSFVHQSFKSSGITGGQLLWCFQAGW